MDKNKMEQTKIEKCNEHDLPQYVFYHIKGKGNLSPCFLRFDLEVKDITPKKVFDKIQHTLIDGKIPLENEHTILSESDIIIDQILFTNNNREDEIIVKVCKYWFECNEDSK